MPQPRRLRRFFSVSAISKAGQEIVLEKDETRHLRDTLRLEVGERCLVTDGKGKEAEARIEGFFLDGRTRLILETVVASAGNTDKLVLKVYVAIVQKNKLDYLIEKSQELGVQEFIPLETERTAVKMSEQNQGKVLLRWNKIAQEAAKQSGSLDLMKINVPQSFKESLLAISRNETTAVFHPSESAIPFSDWTNRIQPCSSLHLFLGPEGGFSEKEISFAKNLPHCEAVSLGKRILKTDTAYLGVVSSLRFLFS